MIRLPKLERERIRHLTSIHDNDFKFGDYVLRVFADTHAHECILLDTKTKKPLVLIDPIFHMGTEKDWERLFKAVFFSEAYLSTIIENRPYKDHHIVPNHQSLDLMIYTQAHAKYKDDLVIMDYDDVFELWLLDKFSRKIKKIETHTIKWTPSSRTDVTEMLFNKEFDWLNKIIDQNYIHLDFREVGTKKIKPLQIDLYKSATDSWNTLINEKGHYAETWPFE